MQRFEMLVNQGNCGRALADCTTDESDAVSSGISHSEFEVLSNDM